VHKVKVVDSVGNEEVMTQQQEEKLLVVILLVVLLVMETLVQQEEEVVCDSRLNIRTCLRYHQMHHTRHVPFDDILDKYALSSIHVGDGGN
jgi:hypothetical protein